MTNSFTFIVDMDHVGLRLDIFLNKMIQDSTRSLVQQWIEARCVFNDQEKCILKPSLKVTLGDIFVVHIPKPIPAIPLPCQMDLDIYYEDEHLLVINKQAGLVVHPGAGHMHDTLVNGLLHHCKDLSGIGGVLRPGIVHRLDKDTSGLMVIAKHDKIHHDLSLQFQEKGGSEGVIRKYVGFVWGKPNPSNGRIETLIGRHPHDRQKMTSLSHGGKLSTTDYDVLKTYGHLLKAEISKVEFTLLTGRTHQIRVHCVHIKSPLIGDPIYGKTITKTLRASWGPDVIDFKRQALHAEILSFIHPISRERMDFKAPLPEDLSKLEENLSV